MLGWWNTPLTWASGHLGLGQALQLINRVILRGARNLHELLCLHPSNRGDIWPAILGGEI